VEQKFLRYCEDYARLEELAGRGPSQFPLQCNKEMQSYEQVEELGEALANQMELGSYPAKGLRTTLEERFGVKVLLDDTAGAGSAASVRDSFGAGVLLNRREPPWRTNFNLAHEFYHLVTWDQNDATAIHPDGTAKSLPEKYADTFASALLLPEKSVRKAFEARVARDRVLSYVECITMAREFDVSTQALLYRLVGLRLVNRREAELAMKSEDFAALNKEQRKGDWKTGLEWGGISERFIGLAFECLLNGKLSRGRFAEMLHIDRTQIDGFLTGYGYDATGDYSGSIGTS
jgi:Zn-dependent peptidase ImmA (M78 family)